MATLINNPATYDIRLSAQELTLVTRALALMAGFKINPRGIDREKAALLNESILYLRLNAVDAEKRVVEQALAKLEERAHEVTERIQQEGAERLLEAPLPEMSTCETEGNC